MAGEETPASANVAVNDHVTGFPPSDSTGERRVASSWQGTADTAIALPRWIRHLAIVGLGFQAFFAMTHFGWQFRSEYGSFLLLVTLLLVGAGPWRELARQPVARAVLLFTAFLVFQAVYVSWISPTSLSRGVSSQLTTAGKLVRLGLFSCFIGWWLSLMPRVIPYLFALMVLGLLTGVLAFMPWSQFPDVLSGQLRPRFGIPENLAGQLAAVAGWLAVCLMVATWNRGRKYQATSAMVCLLAYVGCFCALLFSQSRGAWLAFAVTLPVVIAGVLWMRRGRPSRVWPIAIAAAMSALLLLAAGGILSTRLSNTEAVLETTADEIADEESGASAAVEEPHSSVVASTKSAQAPAGAAATPAATTARTPRSSEVSVASVVSAAVDPADAVPAAGAAAPQEDVAVKAVNIRLQLYDLGIGKWRERPWFGWGMRTTQDLIARAKLDTGGVRHVHLHNAYLDVLVGIGLVGAGLLGLVFVLLMRELLLAWRAGVITTATLWVFAGCFGIVLVANAFDSLLWRFEYSRAPLEILFGCCVAYGLIRRRESAVAVR